MSEFKKRHIPLLIIVLVIDKVRKLFTKEKPVSEEYEEVSVEESIK